MGDWLKKLSANAFYDYEVTKHWDKVKNKYMCFVMLELVFQEKGSPAYKMAVEFDDIAKGNFYTRDWTYNGIPFVYEGDVFWSGFWFQYLDDAKLFVEKFGGNGNWMNDYDEFANKCNYKRDHYKEIFN